MILQRRSLLLAFAGLAACALVGVVVGLIAAAGGDDRVAFTLAYGLVVGVPMLVGLATWQIEGTARFGGLLFVLGALFSLTALSLSSDGVLFSAGRVAVWLVEPALIALILAFPSGRIRDPWSRRLAVAVAAVAALLYVPTALIVERYPEPSPWTRCDPGCPANAFALFPGASGFVEDVVRPLREVLIVLLVLGVAAALLRERRRSPPLLRRALTPVLCIAAFQVLAYAVYQWGRRGGEVTPLLEAIGWIYLALLPAVALSFAAGLVNRRLHVAPALQRLALRLHGTNRPVDLRSRLADALEDPSVRVSFWLAGEPDGWVDEQGRPTEPPRPSRGRVTVDVEVESRRIAVVEHDAATAPDSLLIDAAAAYGLVVLENSRLIEKLRASLRTVSELERAQGAAAAVERRRIERDLHDGAQQRLLALRIHMELLRERLEHDAPAHAHDLQQLAGQVEETLHDVRTLAHGLPPAVLVESGLAAALRMVAADASLPTSVDVNGLGRFGPQVEGAVYFSCVEALQNTVKHAHGATRVAIELHAADMLRFEVRDDGPGFVRANGDGAGLRNIRERLESVGGKLELDARPGRGTRVIGTVPIR